MAGVLVVTGGGRGIGAATARLAAGRGYDVAVNYHRDEDAAAGVVRDIEAQGRRAIAVQGDVAVEADVKRLFETVDSELGILAVLVNNAGLAGPFSRLDEASAKTMRMVIEVNIMGSLMCAREAVRRMSTRHGGAGGAIVNLSSGAATLGSPGQYVWYAGAKGAIDTITKGLALEVAGEGIRVNAVAPGLIDTEIHAASGLPDRLEQLAPQLPMARAGTPAEIAEAILWLASDAASYVTGEVVRVAGGR
jgi:NAD(P)-dependent dehydrogenase (short-subunit alcohol dehydrogenase family)